MVFCWIQGRGENFPRLLQKAKSKSRPLVLHLSHQPRSLKTVGILTQRREAQKLQAAWWPQNSMCQLVPAQALASVRAKRRLYHTTVARLTVTLCELLMAWNVDTPVSWASREGTEFASSHGVLGRKRRAKGTHQTWYVEGLFGQKT